MSDDTFTTDQAEREKSGGHVFGRYLEEFEVGDVYKHWPAKTVTEADDHLFCLITMNHHPLHINDVYAGQSQQGKNVVVGPVVRRTRVVLVGGADVRLVLDAGDVPRIGEREVGVRALGVGELLERAGVDERLAEGVVLLRRSVTPVDRGGPRTSRELLHPGFELGVGGEGGVCARHHGSVTYHSPSAAPVE
jgi:hypothetical protein